MSGERSDPVFSNDQQRALASALDAIIPPSSDGRFPGAGEIGLAGYVAEQAGELAPFIAQGLAALDEAARGRGSDRFSSLSDPDRSAVLEEIAEQQPAFLPSLLFHTYAGYYQTPRVVEALGLEPRPPHPEGHEVEPGDLTLLDAVRERPRLYREA